MKKSMMMVLTGAISLALVVMESRAAVPVSISEHVPGAMNYQGLLVAPNGSPYADGTYSFDIRLYTDANGGTPLWGGTYSSFVKDGYFNIMLGAEGGIALVGTTYTHTDLWKALWPDPANGATMNPLYLGVTPHQGENGVLIDPGSRTELSPRQTLLTAPYAFRSQTSEYANQADGDFTVGGRITAEHITTSGNLLNTVGTTVNVGGSDGNITANSVNINARNVDIDAGAYDLQLTSADDTYATATDRLTLSGGGVCQLVSGSSYVYASGQSAAYLVSTAGPVYLTPATEVRGKNKFLWTRPGSTSYVSPFVIERLSFSIPANSTSTTYGTSKSTSQYSCMIVGFSGAAHGVRTLRMYESSGYWRITISVESAATYADSVAVDVLSINKNFMNDTR